MRCTNMTLRGFIGTMDETKAPPGDAVNIIRGADRQPAVTRSAALNNSTRPPEDSLSPSETWRGKAPIEVECLTCGKRFLKHVCDINASGRIYCSRTCYGISKRGIPQTEESRRKKSEKLSGENAPNWKGGGSRQYKRGYKSQAFKHWRKAVFERDHYTCQDCGQHGGYLTAHHIKPFAEYPDLRYEVSNGVTLCEPCHAQRDNYYARFHPRARKGVK